MATVKQTPHTTDQNEIRIENHVDMKLDRIPGIGKKFREKLLDIYGSEQAAVIAVRNGTTGQVPGISQKMAIKLAQNCFEIEEQVKIEHVLKTPDVIAQYNHLLTIIQQFFRTDYAKSKIQLYYPLPKQKLSLIQDRLHLCERAMQFTFQYGDELERKDISRLLAQLCQFKTEYDGKAIRNRIILTDSREVFSKLRDEEIFSPLSIEIIDIGKGEETFALFQEYCRSYEIVLYIGDDHSEVPDIPNLLPLTPHEVTIDSILPESTIQKFAHNKAVIGNAIRLVVLLKSLTDSQTIAEFVSEFDIKRIKQIKEKLDIIDNEGKILPKIDPQLDQYRNIACNFASYVNDTIQQINEDIRQEISSRSIHLDGKQILELYRADLTIENVRNYIPPEVDQIIQEKLQSGLNHLGQTLNLTKAEKSLLDDLMPESIEYPITLANEALSKLEKRIQSRATIYNFITMRKIASGLGDNTRYLFHLIQTLLEFDFFYGIGKMAKQMDLHIPLFVNNAGFWGTDLRNIDLIFPNDDQCPAIPIRYHVGEIGDLSIPRSHLNLLTGSNSGGKTMCLLTCLQAILLAQMGLPTIGNVELSVFDEIYFFKKSSGQLSAGAFETTLLQFVELAQSSRSKIVFADELEAITEPNAAAKVMAGLFYLFLEHSTNLGVFVTHLAELICKELGETSRSMIRIDGIEATGLDDHLNLMIDRNPKLGFIAKSTPELILRRLANSGTISQQGFFQKLLMRFDK